MKKVYFAGSIRASDLVIAECTTPFLGVGYELAFAKHLGKPVHIFYNSTRTNLSAMLAGVNYILSPDDGSEIGTFKLTDNTHEVN